MPEIKITKKSVTQAQKGAYQITLNLQYIEKETVLIDQDFTELYSAGPQYSKDALESVNDLPERLIKVFLERMRDTIDNYELTQVIFNSPAMDKIVIVLQNELGV